MTYASIHSADDRRGFTLTELLGVITIIALLLGFLYGALRTVNRYSRETITRTEMANIEAAWNQYYAHYHTWPTNDIESAATALADGFRRWDTVHGDVQYELGPNLARLLTGSAITNNGMTFNPDRMPFLDLSRFDSQAAPISAWGDPMGKRYFLMLDTDGNNTLSVPLDTQNRTNLFRRVAVWTVHPEKPGTLLESWSR